MIAHICRLSLRHKSSIQAKPYRLPYARSSYGSLTYLRQKLRRCLQFPLPRKKRLLQLCPDITGTVQIGGYPLMTTDHKGAFYAASQGNADTHCQDSNRTTTVLGFSASKSNDIYGNSSTVQVPASYTLIIIRA